MMNKKGTDILLSDGQRRSRLGVIVTMIEYCVTEQKKMNIQGKLIGNTKGYNRYMKTCVDSGLIEEIKFMPLKGFEKWHQRKTEHDMTESRPSKDGYHYRYKSTAKGMQFLKRIYDLQAWLINT